MSRILAEYLTWMNRFSTSLRYLAEGWILRVPSLFYRTWVAIGVAVSVSSQGADSIITARCKVVLKGMAGEPFAARVEAETDEEVRKYALIIHDDVAKHGQFTEIGAHGQGLSWKWHGVSKEQAGDLPKYKVVGYANPQHYAGPYAQLALQEKLPRIAIGSNLDREIFIDGAEFTKLPLETRLKIVKALHLVFKPERVRVVQPKELPALIRDGTLPQVGGMISLAGGSQPDAGVSMMTLAPGGKSAVDSMQVEMRIDPTQPVIIGKQSSGIPPYLDPNYQSTNIAPTGQKMTGRSKKADQEVSRAHFMLEGEVGKGIWIVNGVPGLDGKLRAPINGTYLTEPGKAPRAMKDGERFLVVPGAHATVTLPNGANLRIDTAG